MGLILNTASRVLLVTLLALHAAHGASFDVLTFDRGLSEVRADGDLLLAMDTDGNHVRLGLDSRELEAFPHTPEDGAARPDDILPDGVVVSGEGDIRRAWLGGPTRRYDHAVLGDDLEASRLIALDRHSRRRAHELPERYVFEDRYPRLADSDGDGTDEIILIRSDVQAGAGVVVYALKNDQLSEVAASTAIGTRHRWMNVVGVADFNDDGAIQIAVVVTPHIGGTLTLLAGSGAGELMPVFERGGFSNHAYGSRELGMSAVLDLDGDATPDMAVPDSSRRALILLSLAGGRYRELHRVEHATGITSGIHAVDLDRDGGPELVYGLSDGTLVVVSTARD